MQQTIFNFNKEAAIEKWYTIDDGVMGGKSNGNIFLTEEGYGCFTGKISKENNGGFSSVHYQERFTFTENSKIILKVKGDGKTYQLRVKNKADDRHGYIFNFETTADWQLVTVAAFVMQPYYRGKQLPLPNFNANEIEEFAFFILSDTAEPFQLLIDSIVLETVS